MKTHHKTIAFFIIAGALALTLALLLPAWRTDGEVVKDGSEARSPFGVYSPGSLAEVPLSAGQSMIGALGLETLTDYEEYSVAMITELGVSWVRIDFLFDGWRFDEPTSLELLQQAGFSVIGTARPVNHSTPEDLSRFQDELGRLVSRYPWIKTWQIGNEPNIHWDPEDYARLFLAGEQAVRERCPDCSIALAGVAARYPSNEEAYSHYERILDAIDAGFDGPGDPFDIFDIHYYGTYGSDADMLAALEAYSALMGEHGYGEREFWVTETSTIAGSPRTLSAAAAQTEEQQAAELVRRFVTMLGGGVARVAWARPYENYRYHGVDAGYYDYNALVYNGLGDEAKAGIAAGTRKMAFFAYQSLIERLQGYTRVELLTPGQYRFAFEDGRPPAFVVWAAGGNTTPQVPGGRVSVKAVDGNEWFAEVSDISLGENPLILEPGTGVE